MVTHRRLPVCNGNSDEAKSHGADWWALSGTFLDERLTPVGGQHLRDPDLDRLRLQLLDGSMEWLNPYRVALGGGAT
jgi:hypothetical protein